MILTLIVRADPLFQVSVSISVVVATLLFLEPVSHIDLPAHICKTVYLERFMVAVVYRCAYFMYNSAGWWYVPCQSP